MTDAQVLPVERCPGCGGVERAPATFGEAALLRCAACGLIHAPEYADPDAVYTEGYQTADSTFGMSYVNDPSMLPFLRTCGHRRLEVIERRVPRSRLLDVGCGTGDVVVAAQERGWAAAGVEPIAESAAIARSKGADVMATDLESSGLPEGSFDVVSAHHVLEHLTDTTAFVRLLARWTRTDGIVTVEVPNFASGARRDRGDRWIHLRPLEHVSHFEPATLRATLERAGLVDVRVRSLTLQWREQPVNHALNDLGLLRFLRWFRWLSRPIPDRTPMRRPTATGFAVLRAAAWVLDRSHRGAVLVGSGRVVR